MKRWYFFAMEDLHVTQDSSCVILRNVRDTLDITNLQKFLKVERFIELDIKYIVRAQVWLKFQTSEVCIKFIHHVGIKLTFKVLMHLTKKFRMKGRMVWREMGCRYICVMIRSLKDCHYRVAYVCNDDHQENVGCGRVLFSTLLQSPISKRCLWLQKVLIIMFLFMNSSDGS